jgi:flagellar motor switch protein FliN/FliY
MTEALSWISERWAERLAGAIESLTGERPACSVKGESAPAGEVLWWRQKIGPAPGAELWAAAGEDSWFALGSWILRCAGIETTEPVDAKNTWLEVLSQAAGAVVADIARRTSAQVSCGDAETVGQAPESAVALEVEVNVSNSPWPAWVAFSAALLKALETGPEPAGAPAVAGESAPGQSNQEPRPATTGLDLLLDIDLPVGVSFGRAQLALKDVLKLTTGAIVELNRSITDPVEVIVNNRVIARGEVVVVEGNYGVRIHEIVSRESRLGSLR